MNRARRILAPAVVPALAIVSAFIVGSIFILITDFQNLQRLGTDPIGAIGSAAGGIIAAYQAMLVGAFGDPARIAAALQGGTPRQIAGAVRPLTDQPGIPPAARGHHCRGKRHKLEAITACPALMVLVQSPVGFVHGIP